MSFLKALALGGILTFVVSAAIKAARYTGGFLAIYEAHLGAHSVWWSWPLLIVATGLSWAILVMTG